MSGKDDGFINNGPNVTINISGTVNGNVAGTNLGTMITSTNSISCERDKYVIRPNIDASSKESHRYLREAFSSQRHGDINVIISFIRKAIETEIHEYNSDLNTIAFSRYLLVHYLLARGQNDREVFSIIEDILKTEGIEKDSLFYCNVLMEKAHVLFLNGEVKKARAIINIVDKKIDDIHKQESNYLQVVGQLALFEGNVDEAITLLSKGMENALGKYAVAICEEEQFSYYQHYFSFLTCIGELYRMIHRPDLSRCLWRKAVDVAEEIGWLQEKVYPLFAYIECLVQYEEYDNADIQLENVFYIIRDNNNLDMMKRYYHLKAIIYLQRNDEWRNAIECFENILKLELSSAEEIGILRTIADIQANHGNIKESLQTLEQAKSVDISVESVEYDKAIDIQRESIKNSNQFVDGKVRYLSSSPSMNELYLMEIECNKCENAIHNLSMSLDIGLGYIDIDPDCAYEWLSKTCEKAYRMKDNFIVARCLIGQACILFGKQKQECEEDAEPLIDKAIEIMSNIPMWEIRARAKMFKGMAAAHREDFKTAYQFFTDADNMLKVHSVRDQFLCDRISDCVDECKYILSKNRFTDIDFDTIIEEINFMKYWYPKFKRDMLHFLWYNRHEDIEKVLIASPKTKAFLVSDEDSDILEWSEKLDAIFDIFTFSSESDYHISENWTFSKLVPVPKDMKSDFFNVFIVLQK